MKKKDIEKAARWLAQADALVVTAGAGIGVDSGLPDFRGNQGFWKAYPPIARLGLSFAEMASPHWFNERPELAWAFYGHRLNLYRQTQPHKGFTQLLEIGQSKPGGYFVFTSNVDGQFQKAGFDPEHIKECHGSIHHFQCVTPCGEKIWDASQIPVNVNEEKLEALDPLPQCPQCGGLARPNILMFGDWAWIPSRTNRQSEYFRNWLFERDAEKAQIVIIEAGAGKAVPTVRFKSQQLVRNHQAKLIRINPRDFDVPQGNIALKAGAAEGIQAIFEHL